MEQDNNRKLEIIIIVELFIIFVLVIIMLFTIKKQRTYTILVHDEDLIIQDKLNIYNNIDREIDKIYDEYTSNIALLEQKILNGESDKKIAYLTFDDGPYNITKYFLETLKNNNVQATFFTIGKPSMKETYKKIVADGHILANHTYSHKIRKGIYKSADTFINDVKKQENFLYEITGYKTTLVRFPGGSSQAGKLKNDIVNKLHEEGYNYVDWTCETGDGSDSKMAKQGAFEWYKQTCTDDKKVLVLLMHDYNYSTKDNLDKIIKDLKERGYLILPLSNKSVMVK